MLISVQGSLAGGAAPGAGGPRGRSFLPDRPPPRAGQEVPAGRAGGTGGPGRAVAGAAAPAAGPRAPQRSRPAERQAPSLRRPGKLRQGGGLGLPPEPLSPAGPPGPDRCLGLCLRVQVFTLAGRTLLPRQHPFPRHCQLGAAHGRVLILNTSSCACGGQRFN